MSDSLTTLLFHVFLLLLLCAALWFDTPALLNVSIWLTWLMVVAGMMIIVDSGASKYLSTMKYRTARIIVHFCYAALLVGAGYLWAGTFYITIAACLWPEELKRGPVL